MVYQVFDSKEIKNCNKKYIFELCNYYNQGEESIDNIISDLEKDILDNNFLFDKINYYKEHNKYIFTTNKLPL